MTPTRPKHPVPRKTGRDGRRGIQSVDAAAAILNVFMAASGPIALSALAKSAGIAASSAHRYLVSLQRSGLIRQDGETGLYDLGPAALRLGAAAMRRLDALGVAEVAARKLADVTGETAFVSIWSDAGPLIVRWFHGRRIIITNAGVGTSLPVVGSSTGRVFAAYLPPSVTAGLLREEERLGHYPLPAGRDAPALLKEVRAKGFAWIDGTIVTGLRAIAAPVFNLQGDIQATVTLLSLEPALVALPNEAADRLIAEAREASRRLGYEET